MRGKVFLSHASQDRRLAARLSGTLERHGIKVWYSATAIRSAQKWQVEIGRALASCSWFLLLGTKAACTKPKGKPWWVQREVLYACGDARYEDRIIPLLCENVDLGKVLWYLPQLQHIDFRDDYHAGCSELLRRWHKQYER